MLMEVGLPDNVTRRWSRFVAIGECMVEMAPRTDGGYAMGFAGDTFNTAWYLRRLNAPEVAVDYLTAVGSDAISDRMLQFMADAGIGTSLAARLSQETVGLYLVTLDKAERSFTYWRDTSAARRLAENLDVLETLGDGSLIYFSGITMAILDEEGRAQVLSSLAGARAAGATVAFDPNIRPRLWEDTTRMCHWIESAAGHADYVFPSADDETAAFGDTSTRATAERYLGRGAGMVIVKDGPRPVLVLGSSGEEAQAMPQMVSAVDTTAAGDAFNAGFLAALNVSADLEAAAKAGCRLSAHVVQGRGALVEPIDDPAA